MLTATSASNDYRLCAHLYVSVPFHMRCACAYSCGMRFGTHVRVSMRILGILARVQKIVHATCSPVHAHVLALAFPLDASPDVVRAELNEENSYFSKISFLKS